QPSRRNSFARRKMKGRKPTPWTAPRTASLRRLGDPASAVEPALQGTRCIVNVVEVATGGNVSLQWDPGQQVGRGVNRESRIGLTREAQSARASKRSEETELGWWKGAGDLVIIEYKEIITWGVAIIDYPSGIYVTKVQR